MKVSDDLGHPRDGLARGVGHRFTVIAPDLAGSGRVVGQSPPAGRVVARGTRVRMTLQPAG